jgi:hypothetical protein
VHQVCSNLEGSSTNAAHAATAAAAAGPDANSSSAEEDWEDEGLSLEGAKGAAPLSNMLGAVRAAAEARAKGLLGSAQGDRGGLGFSSGSVAAGRACVLGTHASAAPLAETFSVGGKK